MQTLPRKHAVIAGLVVMTFVLAIKTNDSLRNRAAMSDYADFSSFIQAQMARFASSPHPMSIPPMSAGNTSLSIHSAAGDVNMSSSIETTCEETDKQDFQHGGKTTITYRANGQVISTFTYMDTCNGAHRVFEGHCSTVNGITTITVSDDFCKPLTPFCKQDPDGANCVANDPGPQNAVFPRNLTNSAAGNGGWPAPLPSNNATGMPNGGLPTVDPLNLRNAAPAVPVPMPSFMNPSSAMNVQPGIQTGIPQPIQAVPMPNVMLQQQVPTGLVTTPTTTGFPAPSAGNLPPAPLQNSNGVLTVISGTATSAMPPAQMNLMNAVNPSMIPGTTTLQPSMYFLNGGMPSVPPMIQPTNTYFTYPVMH